MRENVSDIHARLGRRLKHLGVDGLSVSLDFGLVDFAQRRVLLNEVVLVSHEHDETVLIGLLLELLDPSLNRLERRVIRNVVAYALVWKVRARVRERVSERGE